LAASALQALLLSQRDADDWLEMVDRENGFLMASLRVEADQRRADKQ
jgi:3-phenylpropionate/cinnamic acid dioxygenase small subunit